MSKNNTSEILRWSGILGHRFVVIEPDPSPKPLYGGWRSVAECNTHESAMDAAKGCKGVRVFEKYGRGKWREVRAKPAPTPTAAQAHAFNRKVLGNFFASI